MALPHQSIQNQTGEVAFRKRASFGEPEKVMAMTRERLTARRPVFQQLRNRGVALGPFLEIGADIAATSTMLCNEFGMEGVATEISLHALHVAGEVASRLGYQCLPLRICCDARWLPFADNSFGFVYCFQTLHHFANPEPVIREMHRVLGDGGPFYFAEEPIRRWLCLNLYRCDRLENLQRFEKWLYNHDLLQYIAEAYVGSRPETEWGIEENQKISLAHWETYLSIFDQVKLDLSGLFTRDARLLRQWMRRLGIADHRADRMTANLFGAVFSGLCRARKSSPAPSQNGDIRKLCRCPDCQAALISEVSPSSHFECPSCGPFPAFDGVHLLLRREQLEKLYSPKAESTGAEKPLQQAEIPPLELSIHQAIREGRSPHDLVGGAVISGLRLLNAKGDDSSKVTSGEETVLEVDIECSSKLTNPTVGFIIRRWMFDEPVIIYDTNTIRQNHRTGEFYPGDVMRVRYCQRMELGPGQYTVTTAIASYDAKIFYDWREAALHFEVVEAPDMQGIANLHSKIEVNRFPKPPAGHRSLVLDDRGLGGSE